MKNSGVFLYFRITGECLNFDEISSYFSMIPETILKKGEMRITRLGEVSYKEDCWMDGYELKEDDDLDDSICTFIDRFKQFDKDHEVFKSAKVNLSLVFYPDDRYLNIDFSPKAIKKIEDLGIGFSLSVSSLFDVYGGTNHD